MTRNIFIILIMSVASLAGCQARTHRALTAPALSLGCDLKLSAPGKTVYAILTICNDGTEPCFVGSGWNVTLEGVTRNGAIMPGTGRGFSPTNLFTLLPAPRRVERASHYRLDDEVAVERMRYGRLTDGVFNFAGRPLAKIRATVIIRVWRCGHKRIRYVTLCSEVRIPRAWRNKTTRNVGV